MSSLCPVRDEQHLGFLSRPTPGSGPPCWLFWLPSPSQQHLACKKHTPRDIVNCFTQRALVLWPYFVDRCAWALALRLPGTKCVYRSLHGVIRRCGCHAYHRVAFILVSPLWLHGKHFCPPSPPPVSVEYKRARVCFIRLPNGQTKRHTHERAPNNCRSSNAKHTLHNKGTSHLLTINVTSGLSLSRLTWSYIKVIHDGTNHTCPCIQATHEYLSKHKSPHRSN